MRRLLTYILLACGFGITAGYFYARDYLKVWHPVAIDSADADLAKAQVLLSHSKPYEAMTLIKKHQNKIHPQSEEGRKWLELLITASEDAPYPSQLQVIYEYFPQEFDGREKAALIIANNYLHHNNFEGFDLIRTKWQGRERIQDSWLVLDADRLMMDGKRQDAQEVLASQTFVGKSDAKRLIRLALLIYNQNPKQSWDYLAEALLKDPRNPDIHVYRAKILEAAEMPYLAFSEYIASVQSSGDSPTYRNYLAEFLGRYNDYAQAAEVWTAGLNAYTPSEIWLKAWFWDKVAYPTAFPWKSSQLPADDLQPLMSYLIKLKPSEFWDSAAFAGIADANLYAKNLQPLYWLQLLQDLKEKQDLAALNLLNRQPFAATSWNPALEKALRRVLQYRLHDTFKIDSATSDVFVANASSAIPFFYELEELAHLEEIQGAAFKIPTAMQTLITSDEVYSAILLAAGWKQAGVQLHKIDVLPKVFPDWVAINLVQGIQLVQGIPQAIEFAQQQTQAPELQLLIAQLLVENGQLEEGLKITAPLAQDDSVIGVNASLLASLIYIEKKEYQNATNAIHVQPRLENEIAGREVLARIALHEEDYDRADKLYKALAGFSAEAKAYFARKAMDEKDWNSARHLTEELIVQYPTNLALRKSLQTILQEQRQQSN